MNNAEIRIALNRRADSGIFAHAYVDATDDIAAYLADECGRHGIETQFAFEKMDADETFYLFSHENYDSGLDPWITIEGIDRSTTDKNQFFLDYGRTGQFCVAHDTRIFASSKAVLAAVEAVTLQNKLHDFGRRGGE
jgi:hypothetical protein